MKQEEGETIDEFQTRSQIAAKYCEFEKEVKAQIKHGTTSKKIRRYFFRNPAMKLDDLLICARTLHETEKPASGIEKDLTSALEIEVNKVRSQTNRKSDNFIPKQDKPTVQSPEKTCYRCGNPGPTKGNHVPPKDRNASVVQSPITSFDYVNPFQGIERKMLLITLYLKQTREPHPRMVTVPQIPTLIFTQFKKILLERK